MSREFALETGLPAGDWPATRDALLELLDQLKRLVA
jgi:hypothetical protein